MQLFDWIWAMILFFFLIMAIFIFISIFMDIFRRDDIHGGMKALWILFIFILPFIGCLIYIVFRPKVTAQDVKQLAAADAANQAVSQVSTADELAKLAQLRDSGAISSRRVRVPQGQAPRLIRRSHSRPSNRWGAGFIVCGALAGLA